MSQTISVTLPSSTVYVSGTVNDVAVTWTLAGNNTWEAIADRAEDDIYHVELTIINSLGTSTNTSFTLYYGLNLITDRTQADVDRGLYLSGLWTGGTFTGTDDELAEWNSDLKGFYNASDLNRVIEAMEYLAGALNAAGYALAIHSAPNWSDTSIPCQDDAQTYLEDLRTIHDALECHSEIANPCIAGISVVNSPDGVGNGGIQAVPSTLKELMWSTANTIERILLRVNQAYETMLVSAVLCGTATSGGEYL